MSDKMKVDVSLADWEEIMVDELCKQHNLPDSVVLHIGTTFLTNELSGAVNGKQSLLNAILVNTMHVPGFGPDAKDANPETCENDTEEMPNE